jgi:hypothetical protein
MLRYSVRVRDFCSFGALRPFGTYQLYLVDRVEATNLELRFKMTAVAA